MQLHPCRLQFGQTVFRARVLELDPEWKGRRLRQEPEQGVRPTRPAF